MGGAVESLTLGGRGGGGVEEEGVGGTVDRMEPLVVSCSFLEPPFERIEI